GHGALVERVGPAPGAVDELVGDDEVPRRHVRLERPGGAGPDEPGHADPAHGPEVGPVVDAVGWELVAAAVAGQEGHPPPGHGADGEGRRRRPVGRLDGELDRVVEERVEAGTAEDADLGLSRTGFAHAILLSVFEVLASAEEPEDDESDFAAEGVFSVSLALDGPFPPLRLSVL